MANQKYVADLWATFPMPFNVFPITQYKLLLSLVIKYIDLIFMHCEEGVGWGGHGVSLKD